METVWLLILKQHVFLKRSLALFFKVYKKSLKVKKVSKFVHNWLLGGIFCLKEEKQEYLILKQWSLLFWFGFFFSQLLQFTWQINLLLLNIMFCVGECYTLPPWSPIFRKVLYMWTNSGEGRFSAFSSLLLIHNALEGTSMFCSGFFCFVLVQFI